MSTLSKNLLDNSLDHVRNILYSKLIQDWFPRSEIDFVWHLKVFYGKSFQIINVQIKVFMYLLNVLILMLIQFNNLWIHGIILSHICIIHTFSLYATGSRTNPLLVHMLTPGFMTESNCYMMSSQPI